MQISEITRYGSETNDLKLYQPSLQQGKPEGFDSYDRPSNFTQIGLQSSINQPVWPWSLTSKNNKAPSLPQVLCIISNQLETLNIGKKLVIYFPRDLEIWWMTLKNNRAPLLNYIKLCAAF